MSGFSMFATRASASERLFALIRKHPCTMVLLDPLEPLQAGLQDSLDVRPATLRRALNHTDFNGRPNPAPLLVQLDSAHDPLLDASLALALEQSQQPEGVRQVGGWLFGSVSLDTLAARIGQRLDVAHGAQRRRLRLHDPRVQTCLIHMLDAPRRAHLGAGTTQWLSLRDDGELQTFIGAEEHSPPAFTAQTDASTWQRLQDIGTINRTIAAMRRLGHAYHAHWIERIEPMIQRARECGYRTQPEQIAFAVHGLTVHADFDTHPRVRAALASAHEHGQGFCHAVAAFTSAELQAIATDLAPMPARKGLPA